MDPQITESTESKPSRAVIIVVLAILAIIAYALWPQSTSVPPVPAQETVSTSTTPTSTTNPVTPTTPTPSQPKPTTVIPKPTTPSSSGDSISASVKEGTIPFSTDFTLTLNSNRDCSMVTYVLDYGDNIKKEVQVPQAQCGKVYSTKINHQYQRAGDFTATLSTKPTAGTGVTLARVAITAKNPSATVGNAAASFSISPLAGATPLSVTLSLSANDSNDSSVRYTAVFGDGQSSPFSRGNSPTLSHTFTSGGAFVVTVTKQTGCTSVQCSGATTPVGAYTINVN